eukprot:364322-Chlamydomonas_euryale.AAC.4
MAKKPFTASKSEVPAWECKAVARPNAAAANATAAASAGYFSGQVDCAAGGLKLQHLHCCTLLRFAV